MKMNSFIGLFLTFFLLLFGYIFYGEISLDIRVSDNPSFYFLIAIASFGMVYSFFQLKKVTSRMIFFNSMIFFWSFAFYVNSYKILRLQIEWPDIYTAYGIYFAPILAFIFTGLFINIKIPGQEREINSNKLNVINFLFFILAITIAIYEMGTTGIVPILMSNISESRLEYGLPFLHVVSEAFLKLSFYISVFLFLIFNQRNLINKAIITITVLYFLITFSRSGLMQLGIFSIIIIALNNKVSFLDFNKRKIGFALFLILSFSFLGGIRQGNDFNINEYTDSKIDNQAISWLYGYYFVNIDNLALSISNDKVNYDYKRSLLFISQILGTKPSQTDLNLYSYIGKLNLGTGFRDFSLDWGIALGAIVLSLLLLFYVFILNLIQSKLFILYQSLLLTYIALFPMVNRFSGFIPFFIFLTIFALDIVLRKNQIK